MFLISVLWDDEYSLVPNKCPLQSILGKFSTQTFLFSLVCFSCIYFVCYFIYFVHITNEVVNTESFVIQPA